MFVLEFKVKAKTQQYQAIDDAIRTAQFIRNKCVRLWMDTKGTGKNDLYRYSKELAQDFKFADELNSTARQASAERAWSSISRFYDNCKRKVSGKKGYPQFKKSRSVEYKQSGWKLLSPKTVKFTDKKNIGVLKLVGTWDLGYFQESDIKRVRLIRRADGYYCQFVLSCDVKEDVKPSGKCIGLDVGLASFYTDHNGDKVDNPQFLRKSEKRLKRFKGDYLKRKREVKIVKKLDKD